MWKPDLLLYNSANEAFDATFPTNVIVKSDGSVSQIPPGLWIFFLLPCGQSREILSANTFQTTSPGCVLM
jgi:hypothetical protein